MFKKKKTKRDKQNNVIINQSSPFNVKEAYKELRTNIIFSIVKEECKKIVVTSSFPSEGKSVTACNLAVSLAEGGKRVLLIDADMRRATQHKLLGINKEKGIADVLARFCSFESAVVKDKAHNIDVLFQGTLPPNPAELLGGDRAKELLQSLEEQYDYIIIDSPPVNVVTDATVIAPLVDGVLFIVRYGKTKQTEVEMGLSKLQRVGANVIGVTLTGKPEKQQKKYRYNKYKEYEDATVGVASMEEVGYSMSR